MYVLCSQLWKKGNNRARPSFSTRTSQRWLSWESPSFHINCVISETSKATTRTTKSNWYEPVVIRFHPGHFSSGGEEVLLLEVVHHHNSLEPWQPKTRRVPVMPAAVFQDTSCWTLSLSLVEWLRLSWGWSPLRGYRVRSSLEDHPSDSHHTSHEAHTHITHHVCFEFWQMRSEKEVYWLHCRHAPVKLGSDAEVTWVGHKEDHTWTNAWTVLWPSFFGN